MNDFKFLIEKVNINMNNNTFVENREYRILMHRGEYHRVWEWVEHGYVHVDSVVDNDANNTKHVKMHLTEKACDLRKFYDL